MKRPEPSEHEIQSAILGFLEMKHIFHFRSNTGAFAGEYKGKKRFVRFGRKGAPDIFAVVNGLAIGIEVKRPGKGLSEDQQAFCEEFRRAGGVYITARSLEDVTEFWEERG